ncbi:cytochrome P450 [Lipomyces starkeyi]
MTIDISEKMNALALTLLAAVPVILWYFYTRVKYARFEQLAHIPRPPTSLVWGHLKIIGEIINKEPLRHYDYAFYELLKRTPDNDGLIALDIRPIGVPTIVIQSHELAEQISKATPLFKYSVPKSRTTDVMIPVVGKKSLTLLNDEPWKNIRKQFNAAFAPSNLATFLPQIIDKAKVFLDVLDGYARSGAEFGLGEPCTLLTFDVIGLAVLNIDFKSQKSSSEQHKVVRYFRDLLATVPPTFAGDTWARHPMKHYRRIGITKGIETSLRSIVQDKFDKLQKGDGKTLDRSVLALGLKSVDALTPDILQQNVDSIKTFLFAGHDTTSILLQWAFYELSRTPRALAALRDELNDLLGPDADPTATANALLEGGDKLKLQYTSAVIKETLRLHPPAGTARMVPPGTDFRLQTKHGQLCVDGLALYVCHYALQRDPAVYGVTAEAWVPERWLGQASTSSEDYASPSMGHDYQHRIPVSAWRPFERGPRNCVGQELANLEARLILAMAARRYDFTKVGLGAPALKHGEPVQDQHGQYEVTKPLFETFNMSSKPVDGMKMTVKFQ